MRLFADSADLDLVVRSHGWYDLAPFRYDRKARVLETIVEHEGRGLPLRLKEAKTGVWASSTGLPRAVIRRGASRILQSGVDLTAFHQVCAERGEEGFGWIAERGAGRMLCAPTLFEDAVKVLMTTNCSWELTRSMVSRLIEVAGDGGAFPGPERVAALSEEDLRSQVKCGYRAPFLKSFAKAVADGSLDLGTWEDPALSDDEVEGEIRKNNGFGPYAAHTLMRLLGRHSRLGLDSWSRKKVASIRFGGQPVTDQEVEEFYASFGSFAGLAFWLDVTREWHDGREGLW
jgi:N-glycosylase/DNA lyase